MNKEILPYKEALALKELGFDEITDYVYLSENNLKQNSGFANFPKEIYPDSVNTPFWQQAFRWFREKYNLFHDITLDSFKEPYLLKVIINQLDETNTFIEDRYYPTCVKGIDSFDNNQYQEAELACLQKLIEITQKKQ